MDGGAWWAAVHGFAKSQTRLSDFTFTFHFPALEKEMATHSSVLAWRIPGMGEPGGLLSMGSHRVGHDKWLSSSSSKRWYECKIAMSLFGKKSNGDFVNQRSQILAWVSKNLETKCLLMLQTKNIWVWAVLWPGIFRDHKISNLASWF